MKIILTLSIMLLVTVSLYSARYDRPNQSTHNFPYKVWRITIREDQPGEFEVRFYGDSENYLVRESDMGVAQFDKVYTMLLHAQAKKLNCYFGGNTAVKDCKGNLKPNITWINVFYEN